MSLKYYNALRTKVYQDPVEDWRELMQKSIDDKWDDSSTLMTVQGQTAVGGDTYADESVYVNSVINPSTGESFGDEYRKMFYKTYTSADTNKWLGKMYQFDSQYWLTTNTNTAIGAVTSAILRKCNNLLKWYDNNGTLHQWECVFTRNIGGTAFDYGTQGTPQVDGSCKVLVQQNTETATIPFNQRFIFDGHAFQVQQIDNHYSPTLMTIYIFETQIQEGDDLVNNIAWNGSAEEPITTEMKILPNTTKLYVGEEVSYSVYNYVKGVPNADTFTITHDGASHSCFKLTIEDGNHFAVEAKKSCDTPLVVTCKNNTDNTTVQIEIVLGGAW